MYLRSRINFILDLFINQHFNILLILDYIIKNVLVTKLLKVISHHSLFSRKC